MKEFFTSFSNILIVGLIVVIILQRACLPGTTPPTSPPITLTDTVIQWDTVTIIHTSGSSVVRIKGDTLLFFSFFHIKLSF